MDEGRGNVIIEDPEIIVTFDPPEENSGLLASTYIEVGC